MDVDGDEGAENGSVSRSKSRNRSNSRVTPRYITFVLAPLLTANNVAEKTSTSTNLLQIVYRKILLNLMFCRFSLFQPHLHLFRDKSGVRDPEQRKKIKKMEKKVQKKTFGNMGKAGESDRHIGVKMPKHLFAGKRKMGKTDRR